MDALGSQRSLLSFCLKSFAPWHPFLQKPNLSLPAWIPVLSISAPRASCMHALPSLRFALRSVRECMLSYSVVSDSLQPLGLKSSRLHCPWDSPRQEYRSGLPCPSPGDLPDPGIDPVSLRSLALAGGFSTTSATWEVPLCFVIICLCARLPTSK